MLITVEETGSAGKINRKVWMKLYISRNPTLGAYNMLVKELCAEDAVAFKNFLRMDQTCFDKLLKWLSHN